MKGWVWCFAVFVYALAPLSAKAAAPVGDWPCIQPRVPNLSVGAFWSGPAIDDAARKAWREDPEVASLVPKLVSRRTPVAEAEKLVGEFAGRLGKDKTERLTLVFAGVFSELDSLRYEIVSGIERFTRNQRTLVADVEKARTELDQLNALPEQSPEQRARIEELQTKVDWGSRIHRDRESSLRYVCETPGLLEQRLFAIARALQNAM